MAYPGSPAARLSEGAGGTLPLLAYLALATLLMVGDHRGGFANQARQKLSVLAEPVWWLAAAMALFARLAHDAFGTISGDWQQVIAVMSLLSMFIGAVAAIGQKDIKRLMAYSSIAHMGYALLGLAAGTSLGVQAMLIYMAIYVTMNIGTFAFILSLEKDGKPVTSIDALNMLSKRDPMKAYAVLVLMFSLAGVPPFIGFFAKYAVWQAAVGAGLTWLVIASAVASAIGAFYYLRIVYFMFFGKETDGVESRMSAVQWVSFVAAVLVVTFGAAVQLLGIEGWAAVAAEALVR